MPSPLSTTSNPEIARNSHARFGFRRRSERGRPGFSPRLLVAAAGFALCVVTATAGELALFVGGTNPGSLSWKLAADPTGTIVDLKSSPVYGLRLRTRFIPYVGLEHTIAFSSGYLVPKSVSDVTNADGFVANSNLIVDLPVGHLVPYVTAGIGLVHQYGVQDPPVGTKFAVNFGGGVKIPAVYRCLGLRFDARGYTTNGFEEYAGRLRMFEISAGVYFRF